MTDPAPEPAPDPVQEPAQEPVRTTGEHLVEQGRGARAFRWFVVLFGGYNSLAHGFGGRWWLAAAWVALTLLLLAVQLAPRRLGTAVEADGLRAGTGTRWGRLVRWEEVERLRVQGPYDRASSLVLREGHRTMLLRGVSSDVVRALAAEHGIPLDDPTRRRDQTGRRTGRPDHPDDDDAAADAGAGAAGAAGADGSAGPAPAAARDELDDGPLDGPFRASPRRG